MRSPGFKSVAPGEVIRRQLSWYLFLRVLVNSLFLGGTILYQLRGAPDTPHVSVPYLYLLVGISYAQALASAVSLARLRRARLFIQSQIVWDLLFASCLIYFTGGVESPFAFLFILVIFSASVFLRHREIYFVASAAAILYGSLLDLQYYGYLPLLSGLKLPLVVDAREIFYAVFVNVLAFFLTAFLSALLAERLRRSEQALERKAIDYEELERLNRAILANIGSGLLIVNQVGRIRAFNSAAERLTGHTLGEVYDRDVREVFPGLAVFDGDFRVVSRGEGRLQRRDGRQVILGYASSVLRDKREVAIGLLVTFQDLTRFKELEEQLKRADRLAAVGGLASGLAHEIRNPLASISGSVQLLMEGTHVTQEELRLMRIVVKEADRLSDLLTDFLLYARPSPPKLADVDVSAVLDAVADLVAADPRFAAVAIERSYPRGVRMLVDQQQFHQALWNLAINAAEAMSANGSLMLGIDPGNETIFVEDSGPGIAEPLRDKIFNPFFTTKDGGTGLGLATVHTIVEAHGGGIELAAARKRGARFVIHLPGKRID